MKAIVVTPSHQAPRLVWAEVPEVAIGPAEVLVEVRATAVNRADLLQARGLYPPPPGASQILGLEIAGVITATGAAVDGWKAGDRVLGLVDGGGYAERAAVHPGLLLRLPEDWSFAQGAAIPEVWLTAFLNLFIEGGLGAGQAVLIHAGASGVGTAAIQMAREAGAVVFATAGSEPKRDTCRELGAALAIDYQTRDFAAEIMAHTSGKGVDLILDPVGWGPPGPQPIRAHSRRAAGAHRPDGRQPVGDRLGPGPGQEPAPDRVPVAAPPGFRENPNHPGVCGAVLAASGLRPDAPRHRPGIPDPPGRRRTRLRAGEPQCRQGGPGDRPGLRRVRPLPGLNGVLKNSA